MYRETYSKHYATGGLKEDLAYANLKDGSQSDKAASFLHSLDSYGRRKLETEERLSKLAETTGVKVWSLRLPDVIGPYDDSYRLQKLVLWMQLRMEGK